MSTKKIYSAQIEAMMVRYYLSLPEKSRRHYAVIEWKKIGWGGQGYIEHLFGISRVTLFKGSKELSDQERLKQIPEGKQRRAGGGRKKKSNCW